MNILARELKNLFFIILMGIAMAYFYVIMAAGVIVLAPFALIGYLVDPRVREMHERIRAMKERREML